MNNKNEIYKSVNQDIFNISKEVVNQFKNQHSVWMNLAGGVLRDLILDIADLGDKVNAVIYKKGENPEIEAKVNANRFPIVAILNKDNKIVGIAMMKLTSADNISYIVPSIVINTFLNDQQFSLETLKILLPISNALYQPDPYKL